MTPFDWQRDAVQAFDGLGGLFLAAPAGRGKTWVNAQCCKRARFAVYVCPAGVLEQTVEKLLGYGVEAASYDDLDETVQTVVISYSIMSRRPEILEGLAPDVLVLDESQRTKRVNKAAWSKVPARFIAKHPDCRVVYSSGSIMRRSVVDYGHGLVWALRKGAPCGTTRALIEQCAREAEARPEWWREKLRSTPGVFMVDDEGGWGGELVITTEKLPPLAAVEYSKAITSREAPDGWVCEDRFSHDELLRQLSWGFYMRREPRPSPALVAARRVWAKHIEAAMQYYGVDTPLGARGVFPAEWARYQAAEAAEPAEQVVEWLAAPTLHAEPGTIVWVNHVALAERLALAKGWPYHHEGALDANGVHLRDATAPVVLASIRACSEGVDGAQLRYHTHYVLEPPSDPRVWEQLIARLARLNQPCAQVNLRVCLRGGVYAAAYTSAREGAEKIQRETGQKQWLLSSKR